jgi:hypothetical protein
MKLRSPTTMMKKRSRGDLIKTKTNELSKPQEDKEEYLKTLGLLPAE